MNPFSNIIFTDPRFNEKPSAWVEHIPFAFFLTESLRPAVFVELGTYFGISYFAFCQAITECKLNTRAWAVDTWTGDVQSGFCDQEVFDYVNAINHEHFGHFSTLLQMTFDEASGHFSDGEIDLLHIDGMHDYESVRHDFEHWLPKMSSRGVIIFHDSSVQKPGFGVDQLMKEISGRYPMFEFRHGYGLSVVATGTAVNPEFLAFLEEAKQKEFTSNLFKYLGDRITAHLENANLKTSLIHYQGFAASVMEQLVWKDELIRNQQTELARVIKKNEVLMARNLENARKTPLPVLLFREWKLKRSRLFDERYYLQHNPDVAASGMGALRHYVRYGMAEGREPFGRGSERGGSAAERGGKESERGGKESERNGRTTEQGGRRTESPEVVMVSGERGSPGHEYRVVNYAQAWEGLGVKVVVTDPEELHGNLTVLDEARILIIWRAQYGAAIKNIVDHAREKDVMIIYDVDDYMFDPGMAEAETIDAIRSNGYTPSEVKVHYALIRSAIQLADLCTCTTQELAKSLMQIGKKAFVLPNGYSGKVLERSIRLVAGRGSGDGRIRIGYAGGTLTHQKDLEAAMPAIVQIMKEYPQTLLTVFRGTVLLEEFPGLMEMHDRVEVRELVPFHRMQEEISRFDINIAPLEDSDYCNAKSELKFFEAALVRIPTIASSTPPFRKAISYEKNGFIARTADDWLRYLRLLVSHPGIRKEVGLNAFHSVLWNFSPEQRCDLLYRFLTEIGRETILHIEHAQTRQKALRFQRILAEFPLLPEMYYPEISEYEVIAEYRTGKISRVGVIIPLYNYAQYIISALESVKAQTLGDLDLVVVDDGSVDGSVEVVKSWMAGNHGRFNRCALLRHRTNCGLGAARNTGFDAIQTQFVLPLDADNELFADCLERCLQTMGTTGAAVVYPQLQLFGEDPELIARYYEKPVLGDKDWDPDELAITNYIDAMALVSKACWARSGGYAAGLKYSGLEDYDLWLRFVEQGFFGIPVNAVLARYRVHKGSMLRTAMAGNEEVRNHEFDEHHPSVAEVRSRKLAGPGGNLKNEPLK